MKDLLVKTDVLDEPQLLDTQTEFMPETESEPPKMYQIKMFHDEYTPPDFIKTILEHFFSMDADRAQQVMIEIQTLGEAICGVYTREIAEMKVSQVLTRAHEMGHPLQCIFEIAR